MQAKNIYRILKLNMFIKNFRIKFLLLIIAKFFGIRHLSVRLDPIVACNIKCLMCTFARSGDKDKNKSMEFSDIEKHAKTFFPTTLQLVVGVRAPRSHLRAGRSTTRGQHLGPGAAAGQRGELRRACPVH